MTSPAAGLLWVLVSFLCGALPLSYWLGRATLKTDIRQYGDGNPGAANVWRAGGPKWGVAAILLDSLKGAVPVSLANFALGIEGWWLILAAIAPVAGHAFTPFLRFRGGKALAVTFGIWAGLTIWLAPVILGGFFALWLWLLTSEGWAVLMGLLSLLAALLLLNVDQEYLLIWLGTSSILLWMQRQELTERPRLRSRSRLR